MEASLLNQWFSGQEIKAICWTLIHSLWIGLVIALLCGIVIASTRKSAAALRYRLLCGLLALFVCAIGVTYYLETGSAPVLTAPAAPQPVVINIQHHIAIIPVAHTPQHQNLLGNVQAFLNQKISIIFLVWLLFFVLKSLKMVSGLLYIQRIRNYKIHAVTEELKHRIGQFSSQIGITRTVRLVQSELVKVPVAIGWLKPMILLPMGIAFQLTPGQLDGILWHELAHIRRRDYLVNILQGLVETVFFFNPGLLWLSSLIRTEREACCDDMVLSRMNHKANYLEALLSFGYGEFSQARYAMGIGSGNQLRDRLKRMISQENKRLSVVEKSVLAIGLVVLSAFTTISKSTPVVKHLTLKFAGESGTVVAKHIYVPMHPLSANQRVNDSKPAIEQKDTLMVKDTVTHFTSILFKNSDIDWANTDIRAKDDKGNIYHIVVVGDKIASMEINGAKVEENKLPGYEYIRQVIAREMTEKRHVSSADVARFKAEALGLRFQPLKFHALNDSLKAATLPVPSKFSSDALPQPELMKEMKMRQRRHDDNLGYQVELNKMMNIIADLVKDKVIGKAAEVKWFGLSNTEFIVNGRKLSGEMQQRYKTKYGVHEGYGLYYGPVQMHGTGVFIDAADMAPGWSRPEGTRGPGPKYIDGSDSARYFTSIMFKNGDPDWTNSDLTVKDNRGNTYHFMLAGGKIASLEINDARIAEDKLPGYEITLHAIRDQATEQQLVLAKQRDNLTQQRLFSEEQRRLQAQRDARQPKQPRGPRAEMGIDLQPIMDNIVADLVTANIISNKNDLEKFNLTNAALMVNGKKQPEDIHARLKDKYLDHPDYISKYRTGKDPNFGLHYNTKNGEMGLGITDGPDSP